MSLWRCYFYFQGLEEAALRSASIGFRMALTHSTHTGQAHACGWASTPCSRVLGALRSLGGTRIALQPWAVFFWRPRIFLFLIQQILIPCLLCAVSQPDRPRGGEGVRVHRLAADGRSATEAREGAGQEGARGKGDWTSEVSL